MLQIRLNGQVYKYFKRASVVMDIGAVARAFSFVSSATEYSNFPIKINDVVEIDADGEPILKGYIERLSVSNSSSAHEITVSGRSLLADLVDSSVVGGTLEFSNITLPNLCTSIMQQIGLTGKVQDNVGDLTAFDDITSAEVGQGAYDFLEQYSRKRQVLLTSDGAETLVLERAGANEAPIALSNASGLRSNIKESSLKLDYTSRFNNYKVHSQLNVGLQDLGVDLGTVVEQFGVATDADIRATRRLELNAEQSMSSSDAINRAKWEANLRKADALSYTAVVVGNTVDGEPWFPNTLVNVNDIYANVQGSLLIRKVTASYDADSTGSLTTLEMTNKNAFTLEVEEKAREANTSNVATSFI